MQTNICATGVQRFVWESRKSNLTQVIFPKYHLSNPIRFYHGRANLIRVTPWPHGKPACRMCLHTEYMRIPKAQSWGLKGWHRLPMLSSLSPISSVTYHIKKAIYYYSPINIQSNLYDGWNHPKFKLMPEEPILSNKKIIRSHQSIASIVWEYTETRNKVIVPQRTEWHQFNGSWIISHRELRA